MDKIKFPLHDCGMYLTHNQYKDFRDSVEEAHKEIDIDEWITENDRLESLKTGEVWELQWYPKTPIGFFRICAATCESLLKRACEMDEVV